MSLPDPQLMSDAQSLTVFASAVSQAAVKLINGLDIASAEYDYFKDNLTKLRTIMDRVELHIG